MLAPSSGEIGQEIRTSKMDSVLPHLTEYAFGNESIANSTDPGFLGYPHTAIIATIYIVTSVFGILGNVLVIIGVAISPKLHSPTNVPIVNLAIADLLTCLVLPFQTAGVLSPMNEFPLPSFVCNIIGSVIYVTFTCSAVNLVLIALVRWYVITRSIRGEHGLNTYKKQIFLAFFAWICACIYVYIPVYGFQLTTFSYYPGYKQCFTSISETSDFYHNYLAVLIGLHLVVILTCYLRILFYLKSVHKQFKIRFGSSRSRRLHRSAIKRMERREIKVTKNLFCIVVAFMICVLPTTVSFVLPGVWLFGAYTTAILYFNNCINPILYAFKHPVFKTRFLRLLETFLRVLGVRLKERTPPVRSISIACTHAIYVGQFPATLHLTENLPR